MMKKNTFMISFIMIIILLVISIGQYACYPMINQTINEKKNEYYIEDYMVSHTQFYNYAIDLSLQKKDHVNARFSQYLNFDTDNQEFIDRETEDFEETLQYYLDKLNKQSDFCYQATNTQTQQTISNTNDQLDQLKTDKNLQNKYQWYYQIQFDSEGRHEINFSSYDNPSHLYDLLEGYAWVNETFSGEKTDEFIAEISYESPKNIIITYAVPQQLPIESTILMNQSNPHLGLNLYALPYVFGFVLLTMIITLLIPYRYLEKVPFLSFIANIKFEILAVIWTIITFFSTYFIGTLIVSTGNGLLKLFFKQLGIEKVAPILIPTVNLLYWFIYFALFMILAFLIKYLFKKGIQKYLIENTLIAWIVHVFYQLLYKVVNFDLNDNVNKTVIKIVFLNFIVISIISAFFVFGIFFAFLYSFIIFIILKKKFDEIQQDYEVLLHATKQLSNGDFDVRINEDVGIFNPLKNEFSHIKEGFEKAVQEEVKSQKMKTELISNVSHDLKTPLTSIITYIDLLKNEQLTSEQRQRYLDILERNSLRLKNLIDDLFEVSKVNSGNVKLDLVEVNIVSLIKQAQFECADKLEEKHLDIRINCSQDKIICLLDSAKTYRIFENLFINISKYALAQTRVYLDIVDNENDVTIIFKNISEDEMKFNENEIIERFVQGDKSRNTSGSGLGLAIVKSFTELQGGTFKVEIDGDLFKSIVVFKKQNA